MKERLPRIMKYACVAFGILTGLLLLFVNANLASLAETLAPGSARAKASTAAS